MRGQTFLPASFRVGAPAARETITIPSFMNASYRFAALLFAGTIFLSGCVVSKTRTVSANGSDPFLYYDTARIDAPKTAGPISPSPAVNPLPPTVPAPTNPVQQVPATAAVSRPISVAYQVPADAPTLPADAPSNAVQPPTEYSQTPVVDPDDPFLGQTTLDMQRLIYEVQSRNPSIHALTAAWRAASARYPQAIALDDPMFSYMQGVSGRVTDGGWMVEASQKLSWFGKRQLRGDVAAAEANAACHDVETQRLQLAEASANAYLDYFLVYRLRDLNAADVELMQEFRRIAKTRYEANQATQQDVLQANVDLADLQTRRAELLRMERVAVARLNALLHREIDRPLPPPGASLEPLGDLPPLASLRDSTLRRRPDLASMAAKIDAGQSNVNLAYKNFYPDFEVATKYDAFMMEEMRPQVGLNVNVPIGQEKRRAALREASAELQKRRAEYCAAVDAANFELADAYAKLQESREALRLYEENILPAAEENAQAARANYAAGKIDFLRLISAQRQLYDVREKYETARTDSLRRLAELRRVTGGYDL